MDEAPEENVPAALLPREPNGDPEKVAGNEGIRIAGFAKAIQRYGGLIDEYDPPLASASVMVRHSASLVIVVFFFFHQDSLWQDQLNQLAHL